MRARCDKIAITGKRGIQCTLDRRAGDPNVKMNNGTGIRR